MMKPLSNENTSTMSQEHRTEPISVFFSQVNSTEQHLLIGHFETTFISTFAGKIILIHRD